MTIEEGFDRIKVLKAQKEHELESRAKGCGNSLDIEMIDRELLEINAQIRDMTSMLLAKAIRNSDLAVDYFAARQQFLKLPTAGKSLDGKSAQTYAQLRTAISRALEFLSVPQWEALYLSLRGWSASEIGVALGIASCTAWGRVDLAKKIILEETERAMTRNQLLAGGPILDMRNADIAEAILSVMTPTQAACFYMYFSEGFSEGMAGKLLGNGQAPVHQAITTALQNIDILLGGQDVILKHPEALDELGYKAYCELCAHPELIQKALSLPKRHCRRGPKNPPLRPLPCRWALHVGVWRRKRPTEELAGRIPEAPPGRLCDTLMKDGKDLSQELKMVFSVCQDKSEQRRVSNAR